jgi:hypothetical protein
MKISKAQVEVPDSCPEKCPGQWDSLFPQQGGICYRCPILNCTIEMSPPCDGGDSEQFCMLKPENYREDWALVWKEWFQGDMKNWPELY